jgi:hypothetical protein
MLILSATGMHSPPVAHNVIENASQALDIHLECSSAQPSWAK